MLYYGARALPPLAIAYADAYDVFAASPFTFTLSMLMMAPPRLHVLPHTLMMLILRRHSMPMPRAATRVVDAATSVLGRRLLDGCCR